jgi:hypothetical protein
MTTVLNRNGAGVQAPDGASPSVPDALDPALTATQMRVELTLHSSQALTIRTDEPKDMRCRRAQRIPTQGLGNRAYAWQSKGPSGLGVV